ncbi:T9SS type A sorting domain-containing protein [Flavobacterium difficile]|uniref:T9SS type A sorting domain-containing protein n=1 Tax=Flavobacterium difficile TaxID=2709659 RepID=A0ABX0I5D6_9FLAO|nr:T9SS type A sorting domain-containing protein [Flavobacterium difficile]NHM02400.1 T9SS type A sorting domain-containing protein [Flavobacterium difficile]
MNKINFFSFLLFSFFCFNFSYSETINAAILDESIKTVRLDYQTPNLYESQILLGFMNDMATNGFDPGYDAECPNNTPNQFYFKTNTHKLIIQGVGYYDSALTFPLGILTNQTGIIKIKVNSFEGFSSSQNFYVHDNVTNSYHDIKNGIFEIFLNSGLHENRFTLAFSNTSILLDVSTFESTTTFSTVVSESNWVTIVSPQALQKVEVYNINGKKMAELTCSQNEVSFDMNAFSKGVYVVNAYNISGVSSKKLLLH